ncbi:ribonuclease P protein component [Micromonospora sp. NPDC049679]|uniref:ribonuclease P protein component n=1 Tax=Micromonospora sp. NPDC049679 TaxID=3155920 RepID=UPI0033F0EBDE
MLSAAQRLRRSIEFAAAVRGGRRASRGAVVVHLTLPDAEQHGSSKPAPVGSEASQLPTRAGFVVSKAVGNAVVRNSVRRRLRHLVRERLAELPAGATVVVRALPHAAGMPYDRLAADLDAALATARSPRKSARRPR